MAPTNQMTLKSGRSETQQLLQTERRTMRPTSSSKICPLLDLPAEVRIIILRYLLKQDEPLAYLRHPVIVTRKYYLTEYFAWEFDRYWGLKLSPAILRTCKHLYKEGFPILYDENKFTFHLLLQQEGPVVRVIPDVDSCRRKRQAALTNIKHFVVKIMPTDDILTDMAISDNLQYRKTIENGLAVFCQELSSIVTNNVTVDLLTSETFDTSLLSRFKYLRCKQIDFLVDGKPATDPSDVAKFGGYKAAVEGPDEVYDVPRQARSLLQLLESHQIDIYEHFPFTDIMDRMEDAVWEWDEEKFIIERPKVLRAAKVALDELWEADVQDLCSLLPRQPLNTSVEQHQSDSAAP
ncbi:hypothetical protein H2200_013273 [Cladophialophora chaetospira]|uniref:F-box domain-containing protein n=1 Tax=Cladophialophora chaetospira TaxID=386627 RepID=A0AA38U4X9_9EURO|nr:hypothetical protein H2200_013273 [Cladophialophora chaetospira]